MSLHFARFIVQYLAMSKKPKGSLSEKSQIMDDLLSKDGVVLFVGPAPSTLREWINSLPKRRKLKFFNIQSTKQKKENLEKAKESFDEVFTCSFSSDSSIAKTILPFRDKIIAILSRSEAKMWYFKKIIPHIPYVLSPTETSLIWATDKIQMRKRMQDYDRKLLPRFTVVYDILESDPESVADYIEKKLTYPVMVKPSGLSSSMLVTNCYHREELVSALKAVSRKAQSLHKQYKEYYKQGTPQVLVEELMEGDLYSVDGVVNSKGKCFFYPSVYVKTGKQIGFDDYFGYLQMTPTKLKQKNYDEMTDITKKAVHALGLRNTHFHAELIRSEDGWKVVEIAPRVGGFRQDLYKKSFDIDVTANDIRIRMGVLPKIKKSPKGYTAAMKIFAKKEGVISQIKGEKKIHEIESVYKVDQHKKTGDKAIFAKHGGKAVFSIMLFNNDRSKLLADIRRIEQVLKISVK